MTRWQGVLFAAAAVVMALLGAWGYEQTEPGSGVRLAIGGPFSLVDGDGHAVSDSDFHGRVMMIYFGYTHCPDACPTALSDMALALEKLGPERNRVQPIFITVDPERDNGAALKDYVAAFGPDFVGLTGTLEQLKPIEAEFRVYAAKHPTQDGDYDMDHSSIIFVMDGTGRFVTNFTQETDPDRMAATLAQLTGAKATS
jgi:cytochrome oxidase Cu insertion factor (SCO1/SenC/PrrC family)